MNFKIYGLWNSSNLPPLLDTWVHGKINIQTRVRKTVITREEYIKNYNTPCKLGLTNSKSNTGHPAGFPATGARSVKFNTKNSIFFPHCVLTCSVSHNKKTLLPHSTLTDWSFEWKDVFEGCLTVQLPHEIMWNANLMQQGDFIDKFLA